MTTMPPLPPGFTLDAQAEADVPPLPPGFTLDQPAQPTAAQKPVPQSAFGQAVDVARGTFEVPLAFASGAIAQPIAGLAGLGAAGARALGLTDAEPADVVERTQQALTFQPGSQSGRASLDLLARPLESFARGAEALGDAALDATGSPALAAAARTAPDAALALLGVRGARAGEYLRKVEPPKPAAAPDLPPPSTEDLGKLSQAAYARADSAGVVITPESFGRAVESVQRTLAKEGFDSGLHPDAARALTRLQEAQGKQISLGELENLRRIALQAEGSLKPADRRIASIIVDRIDDYADTLGPRDTVAGNAEQAVSTLRGARGLYARNRKSLELKELQDRAGVRAGQFSGSGFENALRTEFRQLALNPKRMRRFTAEEQGAIRKVAMGGPLENSLRLLGKLAPTGVISGGAGAAAGFAIGGPAGAVAVPAAGAGARKLAEMATLRNVRRAEEIARRGPRRNSDQERVPAADAASTPAANATASPATNRLAQLAEIDRAGADFDAERAAAADAVRAGIEVEELPPSAFREVTLQTVPPRAPRNRFEQLAQQDREFVAERARAARDARGSMVVEESPAESVTLETRRKQRAAAKGGQVVFHGSASPRFDAFRQSRDGGIYFSSSKDEAFKFADEARRGGRGGNRYVKPSTLDMKNPLEVDFKGELFEPEMIDEAIAQARAQGRDGVIVRNVQNFEGGDVTDTFIVFEPSQVRQAPRNRLEQLARRSR